MESYDPIKSLVKAVVIFQIRKFRNLNGIPQEKYMTDKELKRLSRAELLELLLAQTKETERLARELEKAEQMLADRQLQVKEAGDIAHAALAVNGVMEAAQAAAQQYLDNIIRMEQETRLRCEKILSDARQAAEQIQQEGKNISGGLESDW